MSESKSSKGNILVVDGQPADLRALVTTLSEQGYEVQSAASGQLALKAVRTSPPDLILLDVGVLDTGGHEICRRLKADEATRDIPVIFSGVQGESQEKARVFAAGGADYVAKPLQKEEVLARVEIHLALKAMQKQLEKTNGLLEHEIAERTRTQAALQETEEECRHLAEHLGDVMAARKLAEEQTRQQGQFLARVLESLTHPFYVVDANDYTIHIANSAARLGSLSGHATCYALTHGQSRPCATPSHPCPLEEVKRTQKPITVEHVHHDQNGNARTVEVHAYPLFDSENNVVQIIEYALDITERRQAEEALRESERRYRQLLETLQEGIWVIDQDACTTFVNPRMAEMLGYTADEMQGKHLFSFMDERGVEICIRYLERRKQGIRDQHDFEFLRKDGSRIFTLLETAPIFDDDGNYVGAIAGVQDITARRQAEEALRESEAKWRSVTENSPDHVIILDTDLNIQFVNYASPGLTTEELIGTPLYAYASEERQAKIKAVLENVLKMGESASYETEYGTPGGSTIYYESRAVPRTLDDQVIGLTVNARDITERKRAEEEKQSLARFPGENRNPVLRVSRDGTIRYANQASAPLLAMWSSQVGQMLPGTWRQLVVDVFDAHESVDTEVACGEHIFSLDLVPVEKADYANIYGRDITEQVQAREALQKSEALLQETQRIAKVGGWELDLETYQVVWTDEVYLIHEVPLDFEPQLENALSFYAPEDRPILEQAIQRAVETSEPWDLELQFITARGKRLWVRAIGKTERQNGKVVKLSGTFQDITERKQTEQAFREAKEAAEAARHEEIERRREAERRRQIAESLADVLAVLNSNQPLDSVLAFIAEQAKELLNSQAVAICSLPSEAGKLAIQAAQGLTTDRVAGADIPVGQKALRQAVASRRPVVIEDLATVASVGGERAVLVGTGIEPYQALLAAPIVIKDEVYGGMVLYYAQPRTFSSDEVELAIVFDDQVALAIENARLRDQIEQAAMAAERSRLARDLHDSVTQALFSASLVAEVLPQVWRRDPDEAQQGLEELRHLTRGALAEMRTLLLELRPTALAETKLDDLLPQLTEAVTSRAQLLVTLNVDPIPTLPPDVHVTFYRVGQEALHNVVKHAKANQVIVSLCASPPISPGRADDWQGQIRLRVSDDGRGFDPSHIGPDQLGLSIMRERAEAIGARLAIESQPGRGTQVTLVWQNT